MLKKTLLGMLAFTCLLPTAYAQEPQVITSTIEITPKNIAAAASPTTKTVYLMRMHLNADQKANLHKSRNNTPLPTIAAIDNSRLPKSVFIGMNGVPVLDQGSHGACVTFAVTAALDAVLGKGDYISQLCNLELGSYLAKEGYGYSGWEGAMPEYVLHQILTFGIINKQNQTEATCADVSTYPLLDAKNKGSPMSLEAFKTLSENINDVVQTKPILSGVDSFNLTHDELSDVVTKIKEELVNEEKRSSDNRIVFSSFLPVNHCSAGACGRYQSKDDAWVLSTPIQNDPADWYEAGHEMIIIGYNDNAVAIDREGKLHRGLFTLRNSWSNEAGDNGDYYMSYDFFEKFVIDVNLIMGTVSNPF